MTHMHARATAAVLVILSGGWTRVSAQTAGSTPEQEQPNAAVENDANPTRAVLFSLRPEIYRPSEDVTQAALIFRYDQASLRQRRWLPGKRGVILRFEMPVLYTHAGDTIQQGGLGDAYAQVLLFPHFSRTFSFFAGSGLKIPTATDQALGTGKWIAGPMAGPVWFLPTRALFLVKVQNLTSIGGDSARPDVNTLLITPVFVQTVKTRWWVLVDSETNTNWKRDGRTGLKSGVQFGRINSRRLALWVKPEVYWGPNRDGRWNLKFALVWYRI
jgi:hypothetical protein